MTTIEDFGALIRDELGLDIADADLDAALDQVAGWDSVHLLTLLTVLERETGRPISLPAVLEASTLAEIYAVVSA